MGKGLPEISKNPHEVNWKTYTWATTYVGTFLHIAVSAFPNADMHTIMTRPSARPQ